MYIHDATEMAYKNGYENGKAEVAREIFEEIENLKTVGMYGFQFYHKRDIADIKKKYTEGKNNG